MVNDTPTDVLCSVREVQDIGAVGQILETVAAITGLGFVAVAHVTDHSWTTCAVLDKLGFGLRIGDGLDVATTLCEEVRATGSTIVIDHVSENDRYRDHHTPRTYGFQRYISIPVYRPDGACFGTLRGADLSRGVHEGLGLGLYIVSEIARSHGGAMDVASGAGQVTFAFSMPDHGRAALRVAG